ncbi:uncharacterized protein A4U43_C03F31660 [Asparagus officinalis]|uniref:Uncharacterized protein n=1 Tax=Asparagus officinalis TaxID=4686 RepID=A0A5P1FFA9_ASPOF|nr:uncharacterized protein LOC109835763 [Asparagus officinalis]ONK76744.1 uncharacterized protein A4U43_C03F31660 [Asparagus officinalis]
MKSCKDLVEMSCRRDFMFSRERRSQSLANEDLQSLLIFLISFKPFPIFGQSKTWWNKRKKIATSCNQLMSKVNEKRKDLSVEMLMRKRVAPLSQGYDISDGANYLRWLLSHAR